MADKKTEALLEDLMPAARLKPYMTHAREEAVNCAVAFTKAKDALLVLHPRTKGRKLAAGLRDAGKKPGFDLLPASVLYGNVHFDADGQAVFTVQKEPMGGMEQKLQHHLKQSGVAASAVLFVVDENLENESEESVEASAPPPPPPLPSGSPPTPSTSDHAALVRRLASLIQLIPKVTAANPAALPALTAQAASTNQVLKSGDIAAATVAIEAFGHAIATASHAPPPTSTTDLLALFRDTKEDVDAGLSKLQEAMRATQDEDMIRIADLGMYGMTDGEGVGLMKALFELRGATGDKRATAAKAARDAAAAYKAAVFKHVLVDLVDANPYGVPVGIRAKLGPALDTIATTA